MIDTEGRLLEGEGEPNSEFWIHARLYAARTDVGGIVHAHPPACVCLTQIGEPHRVVHNQGGIFSAGVPEYARVGLIRSRELGAEIDYALTPAFEIYVAGFRSTDGYWLNDRGALGALTFRDRQLRFGTGFDWTLANWLRLQIEAGAIAERRMRVHDEDFGDLISRRGDPAGYAEIRFEVHL